MKHFWVEPTLWAFLVQALAFVAYIPLSYIGYRWVRAPLKRNRVKQSLMQLGIVHTEELENMMAGGYQFKHYFWPLLSACTLIVAYYTMTHPYIIQGGLWSGLLEEVINVFDGDDLFPRAILMGRYLFWGFLGAWIYSSYLTVRRFLAYDLTPSVYLFAGNRFALAMAVASIVGLWVGTVSARAGTSFDVNFATVAVITFFIGFFPEQGVNWIAIMAQKVLKQQGGISKETYLSEIEGLSIWHQGRLKQEGIDNVQNLATADVPTLIIDFTTIHF